MIRFLKYIYRFFYPIKPKEAVFYTSDYFKHKKYKIGEYTYGKPKVIYENNESNLKIGKFCSIARDVTIFLGGNHRVDWISTYPFNVLSDDFPESKKITGHPATNGDVVIENDVWIGKGVTIMSGVKIGNGAVVAANTVVSKDVQPYAIVGGNPVKLIRYRFNKDEINQLESLKWWDWNIEKIRENTKHLCSSNFKMLSNSFLTKNNESH